MITYNEHERRDCFEAEVMILNKPLGLDWGFARHPNGTYTAPWVEAAWRLFNIGIEVGDRTRLIKVLPQPPAPPPGREVTDGKVEPVPAFSRTDVLTGRALKEGLAKLPELFGLTPLNRETMESRLFAVKEKFGPASAKNIIKEVADRYKMSDIPADRIAAVITACNELLSPSKPVKPAAPAGRCSPMSACTNAGMITLQAEAIDKVVDVALVMARNLADETNFAEERDRLHGPAFHVCRYCGVQKDVDAVLRWSHAEGCIVNTALQTIENYTDDTEAGL